MALAVTGLINSCKSEPFEESPIFLDATTHSDKNITVFSGRWHADFLPDLRRMYTKVTITAWYGPTEGERTFEVDKIPTNGTFSFTGPGAPPPPIRLLLHRILATTADGDRHIIYLPPLGVK